MTKPTCPDCMGDGLIYEHAGGEDLEGRPCACAFLASPAAPHPAQQAQPMTDYQIDAPVVAGCAIACSLRHPPLGDVKASTLAAFARDFLRDLRGITAAIPAQQAGQPEDAKDEAMAFAVEVLHRVREFVIVHGPDQAWKAHCDRCDQAIERLGAAMSSPTAKKGEGA